MSPLAHEGKSLKTLRHQAWRYGLTLEQLLGMYRQQGDRCAICLVDRPLVVDHDHRCCPPGRWGDNPSGKVSCGRCVRSLICFDCNTILGRINDSLTTAERMAEYLRFHGARMTHLAGEGAQGMKLAGEAPNPHTSESSDSRARASLRPQTKSEARSRRLR